MKKYSKSLLVMFLVVSLSGCGNKAEAPKPAPANPASSAEAKTSEPQAAQPVAPPAESAPEPTAKIQEHLFEAKDMDTIELTGQEILDGKESNMSVTISDDIKMDFHISRDNPNGTKLYAIYNSEATNLASNYINPDVFDNEGEAIADYTYQISCHDFDQDGIKEIIIACGNKKDTLSLFVFQPYLDSKITFTPLNYILGYTTAYVNDNNEICVSSPKEVKTYKYNVAPYDAEYAKLTGPLKVSVEYATEEQLKKYKDANTFALQEEGPDILILPKETLKDFRISYVEYDADNNKFNETKDLYTLPSITPDKPVLFKFNMPTIPGIKVSYTDESGIKQSGIIAESGMDGSLFLIEQGKN